MEVLINKTGNKTIVESARDHFWRTGVTLGDPNCLNTTKWTTQGILGELLEEIRNDHRQANPTCTNLLPPVSQSLIQSHKPIPTGLACSSLPAMSDPKASQMSTSNDREFPQLPSHVPMDPTPKDAEYCHINFPDMLSSVSSMETSDPISDTTSESIQSELIDPDHKTTLTSDNHCPEKNTVPEVPLTLITANQ